MTDILDSYSQVFSDIHKVLVVTAHPDDLELYCGGLVSRLISDGKQVASVKVTSGDMGSRQQVISSQELRSVRESEDTRSMEVLGVLPTNNVYLRLPDGGVENTLSNISKIALQIRIFQPDIIITHNPSDSIITFDQDNSWFNHRDHRAVGQLTLDAAYPYSRDLLFFPEHFRDPRAVSWTCTRFLIVDSYHHPDSVYFDVTDHIPTRVKAHSQHQSQYSLTAAQDSADFFTSSWDASGSKNYETFRFVVVD